MVDAERLRHLVERIAADVSELRAYAEASPESVLSDARSLGHVKYLLVTALGGCVHAANHVCASEHLGPPDDNADAMRVLGRHGVLNGELADTMARAVALRNLLVHEYADIDDRRVVDHLGHLDDVDAFVAALVGLVRD